MNSRPVLIMAGGTGGHVFPALALARELRARRYEVVWLGTQRGIEARLVPGEGIPIEWISVGGLRGKDLRTLLAAPFLLARALWQSLGVMRRRRPQLVVGLGGFASGPGGIAAWLTRRPLVLHEQNAIAGFTNRVLSRFAREVLEAFPGSFGRRRARAVGNPVRTEFFAQPEPAVRFAGRRAETLCVLVVGGSQGALKLNQVVPCALAIAARRLQIDVRHQSGERWLDAARHAYAAAGVTAEVTPFIGDMASAYAWADVVICRAGALTISEIAAVGVAAILVPFAAATDDHQTRNAEFLVKAGAAESVPEDLLEAETLAQRLLHLALDRPRLLAMAEAARALARPAATRDLADACVRCALGPRPAQVRA